MQRSTRIIKFHGGAEYALFFFALFFFPMQSVSAQDFSNFLPQVLSSEEESFLRSESPEVPIPEIAEETTDLHLPGLIQEKWGKILNIILENNFSLADEHMRELNALKVEAGIDSLDEYSLSLIDLGRKYFRAKKTAQARFLFTHSLELSPTSPVVLFKTLPYVSDLGIASFSDHFTKAIQNIWTHPGLILLGIKSFIYPFLWALTFGLWFTFLFTFSHHVRDLLVSTSKFAPSSMRGFLAPVVLMTGIAFPCVFGPLWSLFIWSIGLYFFSLKKKSLAYAPVQFSFSGLLEFHFVNIWKAGLLIPAPKKCFLFPQVHLTHQTKPTWSNS